jgi:hypothetical protein
VSREALAIEDATYQRSWLESPSGERPEGQGGK